jgi:hypothetical protein
MTGSLADRRPGQSRTHRRQSFTAPALRPRTASLDGFCSGTASTKCGTDPAAPSAPHRSSPNQISDTTASTNQRPPGLAIKVRPAEWGQAQVLVSDNLTGDQLATLAAGLRAAPSVGRVTELQQPVGYKHGASCATMTMVVGQTGLRQRHHLTLTGPTFEPQSSSRPLVAGAATKRQPASATTREPKQPLDLIVDRRRDGRVRPLPVGPSRDHAPRHIAQMHAVRPDAKGRQCRFERKAASAARTQTPAAPPFRPRGRRFGFGH